MKTFTLMLLLVASCACDVEIYVYSPDHSFDWNLIMATLPVISQNGVISPFGVQFLLSLLMHSAAGKTKQEITKIDTLEAFMAEEFLDYFSNCIYQEPERHCITAIHPDGDKVESIYTDNWTELYLNISLYGADIVDAPFSKRQQSAANLNDYYEILTNGHVKNVVTADDFLDTSILFVNTLYFQESWKHPFAVEDNFNGKILGKNGKTREVTFMSQENIFNYTVTPNFYMVELPYADSDFVMHIIVPTNNFKVSYYSILHDFGEYWFTDLKGKYVEGNIRITIPKFKLDTNIRLEKIIQDLGIKTDFINAAEITQFTHLKINVSNIVHKAGIEIDEVGTTSHATTSNGRIKESRSETSFIADRSFVYLIENRVSGAILFAGQFLVPLI